MNEDGNKPLFEEVEGEVVDVVYEVPPYNGTCDRCLGSGYVIRQKDGILGVLFTSTSSDSEGKPIKRLVSCDCDVEVTF